MGLSSVSPVRLSMMVMLSATGARPSCPCFPVPVSLSLFPCPCFPVPVSLSLFPCPCFFGSRFLRRTAIDPTARRSAGRGGVRGRVSAGGLGSRGGGLPRHRRRGARRHRRRGGGRGGRRHPDRVAAGESALVGLAGRRADRDAQPVGVPRGGGQGGQRRHRRGP